MNAGPRRVEHLLATEKQRTFERDFLAGWERYEMWDSVEVGMPKPAAREFVVEAEDVLAFNRALGETDPLFVDPEGPPVVHPLFLTAVIFWCIGPEGPGSWIRTPGARNPFQKMELLEPIAVGDTLTITTQTIDRFVRRGLHYLTNLNEVYAGSTLKARSYSTLVLPPTREDVRGFASA